MNVEDLRMTKEEANEAVGGSVTDLTDGPKELEFVRANWGDVATSQFGEEEQFPVHIVMRVVKSEEPKEIGMLFDFGKWLTVNGDGGLNLDDKRTSIYRSDALRLAHAFFGGRSNYPTFPDGTLPMPWHALAENFELTKGNACPVTVSHSADGKYVNLRGIGRKV